MSTMRKYSGSMEKSFQDVAVWCRQPSTIAVTQKKWRWSNSTNVPPDSIRAGEVKKTCVRNCWCPVSEVEVHYVPDEKRWKNTWWSYGTIREEKTTQDLSRFWVRAKITRSVAPRKETSTKSSMLLVVSKHEGIWWWPALKSVLGGDNVQRRPERTDHRQSEEETWEFFIMSKFCRIKLPIGRKDISPTPWMTSSKASSRRCLAGRWHFHQFCYMVSV
jgi:hypothetical protein